jgi:hypothetical protein
MRLWPLFNWLWGWQYVQMANSATCMVRRVRYTAYGLPYVVYFGDHYVFLHRPDGWTVTPLTEVPLIASSERTDQ